MRWFWLRLLHMAPRDLVDLHGRIGAIEESVKHLAFVTQEALAACEPIDHMGVGPVDVFDEEWSK